MQKFLVIYGAPREVMEKWQKLPSEEQKKGMDKWMAWGEAHKDAIVDFGNPVGGNKRVTTGGVTDTPNEIGGYGIVQADSADEAAALFKDSPHFEGDDGGYIELMPIIPM